MAEQLGLRQTLGNRRRIEGDEALIGARAVLVNRPRDQFLAGAGLALNQHRAVHRRDDFERREHRPHRAVTPDDVVEAETVAQLRAQLGVLLLQPALLDRLLQAARNLRELERLDQEVHGAEPNRVDRFLHAAEAGDDDGADGRVAFERLARSTCMPSPSGRLRSTTRASYAKPSRRLCASAASAASAAANPAASSDSTISGRRSGSSSTTRTVMRVGRVVDSVDSAVDFGRTRSNFAGQLPIDS